MIIRRFALISKVGRFDNYRGGGVPLADLNRLTVIFGLNSYGKSTISDIFRSLALGDPSIVDMRKSIPDDPSRDRIVEIGYRDLLGDERVGDMKESCV